MNTRRLFGPGIVDLSEIVGKDAAASRDAGAGRAAFRTNSPQLRRKMQAPRVDGGLICA